MLGAIPRASSPLAPARRRGSDRLARRSRLASRGVLIAKRKLGRARRYDAKWKQTMPGCHGLEAAFDDVAHAS